MFFTILVAVSFALVRGLHHLGKFLKTKNQESLFQALQKIKEELMLLGFISIFLAQAQNVIVEISVPEKMMHHMLPCKLEEREYEQSVVKSKPKPIVHFQTFFSSNDVFGTARRLLSDNGNHPSQEGQHGYCAAKGKVPLLSLEGLHRLHIFIFVLAICHVAISVLTIVFGGLIIRKWKHWEHSIGVDEDNESQHASERAEEVTHVHEHEFIQYHVFGSGKNSAITGWVGGQCSRIANCVLALQSYNEWKMGGKNGSWKYGGNPKPPSFEKQVMRKRVEPFTRSLSRAKSIGDKDSWPGDHSSNIDAVLPDPTEASSIPSVFSLVREILHDKKQEEIPIIAVTMSVHQYSISVLSIVVRRKYWFLTAISVFSKDLKDSRVLTDVGDVPIQEIRDCGVDDKRLMSVIGESVKLVMEEAPLRPLVLGGDHSISFPVIRAVSEKLGGPVDVLHIDAHPDNYDAFEGNIYSHASSFARVMEGDYVRRLLQVIFYSEGRAQAKKFGVEQYEMRTFSRDRPFLENLKLGEGVKGVYISIDVDCLDPAFAPGVSHIEPGGLSFRDVLNILHNLQGDVVAGDVVELNPQRDTVDGMTAMVAAKLVREMAAKIAK
ncbi:hypothetical protein RYX36_001869 [Vicia faba]